MIGMGSVPYLDTGISIHSQPASPDRVGSSQSVGLNRYRNGADDIPEVKLARTPRKKQQLQVDRLTKFKKKNAEKAKRALGKLTDVVKAGEDCFPALLNAVEVCSLGQITGQLQEVVGRFRPMV
jgi:methylmalonyl-CoA mutase